MRHNAILAGLVAVTFLVPTARCQRIWPWWVAGEFGEGQLKLSSDQVQGKREAAFALGFVGGHQLGRKARVGFHVNGWLLESYSLNNPSVGESVSNVMGVVDVFPLNEWNRLFLRGGLGRAIYTINAPTETSGSGLAWEGGAGYEIPLRGGLFLAPMVEYSEGRLGDVHIPAASKTGRRFSAVEFKVSALWHFGRPREYAY
jgi:hypothetical protein